jgi:NAD(P)-dependent dehydrogenase (short-subunit alcohol dehydrogenase family)
MPGRLSGKVALVTGAGSGLGRAAANLFAAEGAKVALLSRSKEEVAQVAAELELIGADALSLPADISSPDQLFGAIEQLKSKWGRLDTVFANAGVNGVWAPLDELSVEEWDSTLKINLCGTFLTMKFALPLLKQRGGSIIITSSVNGTRFFGNTGATAYACSKAAQVALAKMTALELAPHRIRVNVICPGWIETHINDHPEKRHSDSFRIPIEYPDGPIPLTGKAPGRADQVARLVLFLASEDSDHITGSEIYIDGAQSLLQG